MEGSSGKWIKSKRRVLTDKMEERKRNWNSVKEEVMNPLAQFWALECEALRKKNLEILEENLKHVNKINRYESMIAHLMQTVNDRQQDNDDLREGIRALDRRHRSQIRVINMQARKIMRLEAAVPELQRRTRNIPRHLLFVDSDVELEEVPETEWEREPEDLE